MDNSLKENSIYRPQVIETENDATLSQSELDHDSEQKNVDQDIRQFARTYFEGLYDVALKGDLHNSGSLGDISDVHGKISEMVGVKQEWSNEKSSQQFRDGIKIFLDEMLSFLNELKQQKVSKKVIEDTTYVIYTRLFSMSPCLSNYLDLVPQIDFAAKITSLSELDVTIGPNVTGDIVHLLSFNIDNSVIEKLDSIIANGSVSEQLDYLRLFEKLSMHSLSESHFAQKAYDSLFEEVKKIARETKYPLVRFRAELLQQKMQMGYDAPLDLMGTRFGFEESGESVQYSRKLRSDHVEISDKIKIDSKITSSDHLLYVARDAIGLADRNGLIYEVGNLEVGNSEKSENTDSRKVPRSVDIDDVLDKIEESKKKMRLEKYDGKNNNEMVERIKEQFVRLLSDTDSYVFSKHSDYDGEARGRWWRNIGVLESDEWIEWLENRKKIHEINRELKQQRNELMFNTGKKYTIECERTIADVVSLCQNIEDEDLKKILEEVEWARNSKNVGLGVDQLSNILRLFESGHLHDLKVGSRIVAEIKDLTNVHNKLYEDAEKKYQEISNRISSDNPEVFETESKYIKKIYKERDVVLTRIERAVTNIKEYSDLKKTEVHMETVDDSLDSPSILPFGSQEMKEDDVLLFQQLHRPSMREHIEKTFGVQLKDLSLREQMHLLRYLSEQDDGTISKFIEITHRTEIDKQAMFGSFFACAEYREIGNEIIDFADRVEPEVVNQVFEKYRDFTVVVESIEAEVEAFFANKKKEVDTRVAVQEIVKRANRALLEVIRSDDPQKALEVLEKVSADSITFASIFKTAFKGDVGVDFKDVRGLDFTQTGIEDLRAEEKRGGKTIKQMLDISVRNWAGKGELGMQVIKELKNKLEEKMDTSNNLNFYILKKDGEVISFIRFEPILSAEGKQTRRKYGASFNVHPNYRGSAIGESVIYNAIDKEAESYILEAESDTTIDACKKYIEHSGSSIVSTLIDIEPDKMVSFKLVCDREKNKLMRTKQMTENEIVAMLAMAPSGVYNNNNVVVFSLDYKRETIKIREYIDYLTGAGYEGTRYFDNPEDSSKRIFVFEKLETN